MLEDTKSTKLISQTKLVSQSISILTIILLPFITASCSSTNARLVKDSDVIKPVMPIRKPIIDEKLNQLIKARDEAVKNYENAVSTLNAIKNLDEHESAFNDPTIGKFSPLNSVNKKKFIKQAQKNVNNWEFHKIRTQKALDSYGS